MSNVTVIGAQWGDEGKGKVVDWLSVKADVVVRFQGGHNAGHTLVVDGITYKLSLLPSGIVRPNKLSIIGSGVVLNPWALFDEIATLKSKGVDVTPDNLRIAENVTLILPFYGDVDKSREVDAKIGTTGRGIGIAYEDKAGRRALRACDILDLNGNQDRIDALLKYHGFEHDKDDIMIQLAEMAGHLEPFLAPTWNILDREKKLGKNILFEGAQGVMLDTTYGTYPYVTSSNTVSGEASTGSGMAPNSMKTVLGITKAYTTRVGGGPFPTELVNGTGEKLGQIGNEFGTVTGRKRRCGWFDAVMVKQACIMGGIDSIVLTKLDVLDSFDELKICVAYELDGNRINYFPSSTSLQKRVIPIYETFDGWLDTTHGTRQWRDIPAKAVKYIRRIEELIERPLALLSTSPERDDMIVVRDPFTS